MKTLIDSYQRTHTYLRISVTDRCNLRCQYCMPAGGIRLKAREEILRFEEIVRLAEIFAKMGVNKIRLTGGEPLVRKNVCDLMAGLSRVQEIRTIGMTTNGTLLSQFIPELKAAGLTNLNIGLDTLQPERFRQITGRDSLSDVLEGIDLSLQNGFSPLKINMVVMGGVNHDEIGKFVEFARHRQLTVRFIEYMPFKSNRWSRARFIPWLDMKKRITAKYDLQPCQDDGESSSIAQIFKIPGFRGKIGFITPLSDHFCDTCSRLRLTADGFLKSCLFYSPELNLKALLRNGIPEDEIADAIQAALFAKPQMHPSASALIEMENRHMTEIGG